MAREEGAGSLCVAGLALRFWQEGAASSVPQVVVSVLGMCELSTGGRV